MKGKSLILILIVVIAVLVFVFGVKREEAPPPATSTIGLNAPAFALKDISGNNTTLSEMKGSVVFVNFWASWCQPCKEEMPAIQAVYNTFRQNPSFRMVTILFRDDYERAKALMRQGGFDFPVFIDPEGKSAAAYGVTGVPETYVVSKKGILREKVIGPEDWSSPKAMAFIDGLLKE